VQLAQHGAAVLVGYNSNGEAAREIARTLPGNGHEALKIDVTSRGDIEAAVDRVGGAFGKLDILVNTSGVTRRIAHDRLDELDDALFDLIMQTNVRGAFAVIRAFTPLLRRGMESCIVNISSTSARSGRGSNIAYCAAKAALDNMGLTLSRVVGPEIRVLTVSPGAVESQFVDGRTRADLEVLASHTALRRVIGPENVALAILGCITHLRTSTGTIVTVDGGAS
jgi:3-oxoacyl-[acyl-carrier protein] reductase